MFAQWITDSDLGNYSSNHVFTAGSPLLLQYVADPLATVALTSGTLPTEEDSWTSIPGYIYITGIISSQAVSTIFDFTFTITNPDGTSLDRAFKIGIISSNVPLWLAPPSLPTVAENYSFNLNPLVLPFSADRAAKVTLINGEVPAGLEWNVVEQTVVITGESANISYDHRCQWTFRITNPNRTVADRTFTMQIQALAAIPDWTGQSSRLGYVGSRLTKKFTVVATGVGNTFPTYTLRSPIPAGMSIDSHLGVITYTAPAVVADRVTEFVIRATVGAGSSDTRCSITVLTVPHAPVWVEPDGAIFVPQDSFLESYLLAIDLEDLPIAYSLAASDPDFPFSFDSDGLLYGKAPHVKANRSWTATLRATSSHGSTNLVITVTVTKINAAGVLVWDNADVDIVGVTDGRRAVYDIGATSTRTPTVKHSITGGQCPPGMVLDKIQGRLVGYVDYHPMDKDYWFDIIATDGIDTIARTIHMQVVASYGYQFADVSIPLWGEAKDRWLDNNTYTITNPGMHVNVSVESNLYSVPGMSLIRGLGGILSDPERIIAAINPSLQEMSLRIGAVSNVVVDAHGNQLIYRHVIDPQAGSDAVEAIIDSNIVVIRPPSLDEIRRAFVSSCGFANGAEGSRGAAFPAVDSEQGSISSVVVASSGNGYIFSPEPLVIGSGTGARLRSIMRSVNLRIVDRGIAWTLGERIKLDVGDYITPAEFVVNGITGTGGLSSVVSINDGQYYHVPVGKIYIRNAAGEISSVLMDLGIDHVDVVEPGIGYEVSSSSSTTTSNLPKISFSGNEKLEAWQTSWTPMLPVAQVSSEFASKLLDNNNSEIRHLLDGQVWQVGELIYGVQGLYWQGSSKFDRDDTTFDGNTTGFEEYVEPRETILDMRQQTFDLSSTTLDIGSGIRSDARANWGRTIIDEGTTAFDFYTTIFDSANAPTESSTLIRKLIRLSRPQITEQNVTDNL